MADEPDILSEFAQWMEEKKAAESAASQDEEYVEIWKGDTGARVKRSAAKSFLNTLGIDVDPAPESGPDTDKGDGKAKRSGNPKPSGTKPSTETRPTTARKYFTKS